MIWSSEMLHYAGINMNQGCVKGNSMNYDALIKHVDLQRKNDFNIYNQGDETDLGNGKCIFI